MEKTEPRCTLKVQARSRGGRWAGFSWRSYTHLQVQVRSKGGRWCWTFKRAQKRSGAGRWIWSQKVGLLSLQLCYGHCPCDCSAQQLKWQLHGTLLLFWRWSTASLVFGSERVAESSPPPPPPPTHPIPVPNKPPHFCGHKAKCLLTY